jgi:hypothetical protein
VPRLLALGGMLFLAAREGEPWLARPAEEPIALGLPAAWSPDASDDDVLLWTAAGTLPAADPVIGLRLARLARYLELGGTAEHGDARTAADDDELAAVRALGLAASDVVVRRYLVEVMRLALSRPGATERPSDDELRAAYERDAEQLAIPARVRARHVYLSRARRGGNVRDDALRVLAELRERGVSPAEAAALGDPFARGATLEGSRAELERAVGRELADALDRLPERSWQGPLASPWGVHLVWIERRTPARPPPFDVVRGRVAHRLLRERGDALLRERIDALRARHGVAPATVRGTTPRSPS